MSWRQIECVCRAGCGSLMLCGVCLCRGHYEIKFYFYRYRGSERPYLKKKFKIIYVYHGIYSLDRGIPHPMRVMN